MDKVPKDQLKMSFKLNLDLIIMPLSNEGSERVDLKSRHYSAEMRFTSVRDMFTRAQLGMRNAKEQLMRCKSEDGNCKRAEASLDLKMHQRNRLF